MNYWYFSIPRPKLKKSSDLDDPYHGSQSSHGYGRRVSGSDSGVYSSVSGYSSTDKILRNLNHHLQSPPVCDKEKASWRNLILRESETEADLCSQFTRMYQRNKNYKRKNNKFQTLEINPGQACHNISRANTRCYHTYSSRTARCWEVYRDNKRCSSRFSLGMTGHHHRRWSCPTTGHSPGIEQRERDITVVALRPERRRSSNLDRLVMDL